MDDTTDLALDRGGSLFRKARAVMISFIVTMYLCVGAIFLLGLRESYALVDEKASFGAQFSTLFFWPVVLVVEHWRDP